jgi:hypothetical protein
MEGVEQGVGVPVGEALREGDPAKDVRGFRVDDGGCDEFMRRESLRKLGSFGPQGEFDHRGRVDDGGAVH